MKDWVRIYDTTDMYSEVEGSEWNKVTNAMTRYADSGQDEVVHLRGRGGGLTVVRASQIITVHYTSEESYRGMVDLDARTESLRREVRKQYPELNDG